MTNATGKTEGRQRQLTVDLQCARCGKEMAAKVSDERILNRVIDVLHEHGLYAYFLFLLSEGDAESEAVKASSAALLKEYRLIRAEAAVNATDLEEVIEPITAEMPKLFFAIDLLEKALTYARYYASAPAEPDSGGKK